MNKLFAVSIAFVFEGNIRCTASWALEPSSEAAEASTLELHREKIDEMYGTGAFDEKVAVLHCSAFEFPREVLNKLADELLAERTR